MPEMKKLILLQALLLLCLAVFSQNKELVLRKTEGSFYLEHKVAAKENFYSLSRLYNVPAKSIAAYNKVDMEKGLAIDQKLKIPLSDSNFTMSGNSGTPVYYRAGLNTSLHKISEAYRNVPVQSLKYWNQRTKEDVAEGEKLIIGFLISKAMPSITLNHPPVEEDATPVVKTEPIAVNSVPEEKPQERPVIKNEEPVAGPEKVSQSEEHGYFKPAFEQQARQTPAKKNKTVTAGIFKTLSGWEDGKYYVLADELSPGTIVKLVNPSNNSAVYAKVLGEMSGIKMNEHLDIRISNAAAAKLSVTDTDKFIMKMIY
jgi:LysM repeat protein